MNGTHEAREAFTIAYAAVVLNVPETTLRRALRTVPEYAARTQSKRRQTATGERVATVLPPDLMADLAAYFARQEAARKPAENAAGNAATNGTGTTPQTPPQERQNAVVVPFPLASEGELPAVAYQAIIGRQEREIEYLKQLLGEANAREQDANERQRLTLEALGREQTLRALAAPVPDVPAQAQDSPHGHAGVPQEATGGPTASDGGEVAAEAGQSENSLDAQTVLEQSRRRSWWPFGRKTSQ